MSHSITFVDDDALPDGTDFVFVEVPNGAHIFYRESALTEQTLEDSWAAYRTLKRHPPVEPTAAPALDDLYPLRDLYPEREWLVQDARTGFNWQLYVA